MTIRNMVLSLSLVAAAAAAGPGGYKVVGKIPLPGDGGWDYLTVDAAARRLYVSHATTVEVIDIDTNKVVGQIANQKGVHGVVVFPEGNRGFISNGRGDVVVLFDLKTLAVTGEVKTGKNPDAIFFDPAAKRVFANNGGSGSATAIDAATGTVAGTVDLGGKPEAGVADGKGLAFIAIEDKNEIVRIDTNKLVALDHWKLEGCDGPSPLVFDSKTERLFTGCGNKVMKAINATNGRVIATLPIGDRVDAAAFDPSTNLVFFSNGEGTVTVIQEEAANQLSGVETVTTQPGAKTLALDPKTHRVYLSVAEYETTGSAKKGRAVKPGTFSVLVLDK